jgi:hypothetical protein
VVSAPTIRHGIPPGGRADAARLRSEAFSRTLAPALGNSARAVEFLASRLDASRFLARAPYEPLGFYATPTAHMGPLGHLYGFSTATEMVRPVKPGTPPR